MPWALLLNRWALVAILLAAVGAWGGWQKIRADQCAVESEALRLQAATLGDKIATQNAAVDDLAKKGAAARAAARQAQSRADVAERAAQPEIERLRAELASKTPSGKSCTDALAEIRGVKR